MNNPWILWSATLSPYAIKVDVLLRQAGLPFIWLPKDGGFAQAFRAQRRATALQKYALPMTWPPENPLQERPLVPYLLGPNGENLFDSSAIGEWLQAQDPQLRLLPDPTTAEGFVVRLIDEALDELGLYMVHHNRWVNAAADNGAGQRLAREFKPLLGPFAGLMTGSFPARQVRRLPYLFSVSGPETDFSGLPSRLRPPTKPGFPPTHRLLDQAFDQLLDLLEPLLSQRRYLLGERLTLADASVLGQLGMNRSDPSAWEMIEHRAPVTARWIDRHYLRNAEAGSDSSQPNLQHLEPLLHWCTTYFVPLMQQNYRAWQGHREQGVTHFNEAAFDRGLALYQGELAGHPFRSVAKTFQVDVWQRLQAQWMALPAHAHEQLLGAEPSLSILGSLEGETEVELG